MILSKKALLISAVLAVSVICRAQQYDNYPDYQEYANEYGEEDNLYKGEHCLSKSFSSHLFQNLLFSSLECLFVANVTPSGYAERLEQKTV